MARRFNAGPRDFGARRKRIWSRTPFTMALLTDAAQQQDLLSVGVLSGLPKAGLTVARVRLQMVVRQTSGTGTGLGALGFVVASQDTDADDHNPITGGLHADWMAYQSLLALGTVGSATMYTSPADAVDVKAMRKVDEFDQTLWLVAGHSVAATTITVQGIVSTLVLLP